LGQANAPAYFATQKKNCKASASELLKFPIIKVVFESAKLEME
jgi:hypothetical protein